MEKHGVPIGVFLDPPYSEAAGREEVYTEDSMKVAVDVRRWALDHGNDPRYRIALCGYEGEHQMPASWENVSWKAQGGYENQARNGASGNSRRERVWFSPHCLKQQRERQMEFMFTR